MRYAIVQGNWCRHVVRLRLAQAPYGGEIADLKTICGVKRWTTTGRVYSAPGKALKRTSCIKCARSLDKMRNKKK